MLPTHAAPAEGRIERDLRLILAIQGLRAFLYGFGSVLLGTSLSAGGLSDFAVGAVFTSMLAGMALASIAVGLRGDRVGRRRLYVTLLLVMGAAGTVFALTRSLPALMLAALTGTMSTDPNESGPITSLEQAMIGHAPAWARARVFGRYNAIAYLAGAVGALAAGGPAAFRHALPALPADQRWLLAFAIVALVCARLARGLSREMDAGGGGAEGGGRRAKPRGEPAPQSAAPERRPLVRSRAAVTKLAALFALDSFAGGFIVQTFLVFWFHRRFGPAPSSWGWCSSARGCSKRRRP